MIFVHAVPTLASLASPAAPMAGRASRLAAALVVLVLGAVYSASLYITCDYTQYGPRTAFLQNISGRGGVWVRERKEI